MGLDAFAAAETTHRGPRCACCVLRATRPELWQEVLNGRARPVPHTYPTIARYLRSMGESISHNQLRDHFQANHEGSR